LGFLVGIWDLGFGICERLALAHDPITTKVTWTREIGPILDRRCVSCHQAGGYAGFSLTTYEEARPWAVAIKEEVLAGDMPPWGAAPGIGHFANDRRPTRHEQELIAAWVDGGAPYSPEARTPAFLPAGAQADSQGSSNTSEPATAPTTTRAAEGTALPLAPVNVTDARERVASVELRLPQGMTLTAWTLEPGIPFSVERAELELGTRWLGTWTPGEESIAFPDDTGAPLTTSATFTVRMSYRAPQAPAIDYSRLRIWMANESRSRSVSEATVVRSWRPPAAVELLALRPAGDVDAVQVIARFANGRAEPIGVLHRPSQGPHPTYRLTRPLALPLGARVESTAPVRLLYSTGATRTVKPNVRRRPRR
jgi:hypothetical protein